MSFDFDSLYQTFLSDTFLHDTCNYPSSVQGFLEYCNDMLNESSDPDSDIDPDPSWDWVLNNAPES